MPTDLITTAKRIVELSEQEGEEVWRFSSAPALAKALLEIEALCNHPSWQAAGPGCAVEQILAILHRTGDTDE